MIRRIIEFIVPTWFDRMTFYGKKSVVENHMVEVWWSFVKNESHATVNFDMDVDNEHLSIRISKIYTKTHPKEKFWRKYAGNGKSGLGN